jgi:hypothetical protein
VAEATADLKETAWKWHTDARSDCCAHNLDERTQTTTGHERPNHNDQVADARFGLNKHREKSVNRYPQSASSRLHRLSAHRKRRYHASWPIIAADKPALQHPCSCNKLRARALDRPQPNQTEAQTKCFSNPSRFNECYKCCTFLMQTARVMKQIQC